MTEQTELRIPFKDLTAVSVECEGCSAEINFDLQNTKWQPKAMKEEERLRCPICSHLFDEPLRVTLYYLALSQGEIRKSNQQLYCRIRKSN